MNHPTEKTLRELHDVAIEAAWQAGQITLSHFQTALDVEWKPDESPVTMADKASEQRIREVIQRYYPSHTLVGEEYGETSGSSPYRWIIDPIDGTRSFARGIPLYSILIGLEYESQPVVGVIYVPALNEWVTAIKGQGCYWNHRRCSVSTVSDWNRSLVMTGDDFLIHQQCPRYGELLQQLNPRNQRNWGDSYAFMLVATGRAEAAFDPQMHPWDCGPFPTILTEAGGRWSDFDGQASIWNGSLVISNGQRHEELLGYLRRQSVS